MSIVNVVKTFIVLPFFFILSNYAQAQDAPRLNVKFFENKMTGKVPNGLLLGRGDITYQNEHIGFQVWAEEQHSEGQPNRYVLVGQNDSRNKLYIRLERDMMQMSMDGRRGVFFLIGDRRVTFDIIADGEQVVIPDRYSVELRAAALLP